MMNSNRLLKVGNITHVSCIDRRPAADGTSGPAPYAQLDAHALGRLESLCALFGARPARVMARCAGPTSEVFLELANGVQIQYFGSVEASRGEQRLWVEGPRGSLLQEGAVVWWRKRGWPKFLPCGIAPSLALPRSTGEGREGALLAEAIRRSSDEGLVVSLGA